MKKKTNSNSILAVCLAMAFCFIAYMIFSVMAWITYGSNIKPSIFENIKGDKGFLSILLRILFLFIFMCNIPFVFFAGRECFITIILEMRERRVSKKLIRDI